MPDKQNQPTTTTFGWCRAATIERSKRERACGERNIERERELGMEKQCWSPLYGGAAVCRRRSRRSGDLKHLYTGGGVLTVMEVADGD
ncbi:hypothetical protein Hdeb2414_s0029g00705901 [Helianthus debilis subsp. tardiflorus]